MTSIKRCCDKIITPLTSQYCLLCWLSSTSTWTWKQKCSCLDIPQICKLDILHNKRQFFCTLKKYLRVICSEVLLKSERKFISGVWKFKNIKICLNSQHVNWTLSAVITTFTQTDGNALKWSCTVHCAPHCNTAPCALMRNKIVGYTDWIEYQNFFLQIILKRTNL